MKLLLALIIFSANAFGGLPPTSSKGQQDASKSTTFNFETPNRLATNVGGAVLFESGNNNILANPSFEHSTATTSWTSSIVTPSASLSTVIHGKKALCFTASAQAFTLTQDSTLYASQFADGVQGLAFARIKSNHSGAINVCPRNAGTNSTNCVTVQPSNLWGIYKIPFILGASSNGISISAASGTGTTCIDDTSVSAVDLKVDSSPVGPWIDYGAMTITATTTAPTKATTRQNDNVRCRISGQDYECEYIYYASSATGSTAGSGGYIFNLPTGIEIDTTIVPTVSNATTFAYSGLKAASNIGYGDTEVSVNGDTTTKCDTYATSSTTFQASCFWGGTTALLFSSTGLPITNAGTGFKFTLKFRGKGLSSNFNTYTSTNADTDWASCGHTAADFAGLGTVTNIETQCKRQGSDLLMRGNVTTGTPSATEIRIGLKLGGSSLTSRNASSIPSIQLAGTIARNVANGSYGYYALIEPSVTYLTVSAGDVSRAELTKQNGSSIFGASNLLSINARIPISTFEQSNVIIGTFNEVVTTPGVSKPKTVSAQVSASGVVSRETGDWINGSCSLSTATFTCNFVSGTFSDTPNCFFINRTGDAVEYLATITAESSSSISYRTVSWGSGSDAAAITNIMCHGASL